MLSLYRSDCARMLPRSICLVLGLATAEAMDKQLHVWLVQLEKLGDGMMLLACHIPCATSFHALYYPIACHRPVYQVSYEEQLRL
jgi:hypothetical protein